MVNKCVVVGCEHGYTKRKRDKDVVDIPTAKGSFHFPANNDALKKKWTKFVSRDDWIPSENSVICSDHFESTYLVIGKRIRLRRELDPIPTIYPIEHTPVSSLLNTTASSTTRKPPKDRIIKDEYDEFLKQDKLKEFQSLDQNCAPDGFLFQKCSDHVVYYRLDFTSDCTQVAESIKIDRNFHVKLSYRGSVVPLPEWFRQGHQCKLSSILTFSIISQLIFEVEFLKYLLFWRK